MARPSIFVKVPRERIGALIGPDGRMKETVEKQLSVELQIDSQTGNVTITLSLTAEDPSVLFRAKEVITAIGRGFSPERASRLLQDDDTVLVVIDLRNIVGRSQSDIKRLKGRIIGKEGKTRRIIEELTDASVSVHGHTISIIGDMDQAEAAREAIKMFIKGSQHRTVYRFLHKKRRDLKKKQMELWKPRAPL
ncbi:MAG: KH domain-containing protein [Candidatus Bathyarchaeota archaeon]|nr:KH domain-containing protein [Candidatus Bathyarchaeota archaeon]MDH5713361.1 KH domain-containing protein [Candidatus Bathyarchaeota archaeon]